MSEVSVINPSGQLVNMEEADFQAAVQHGANYKIAPPELVQQKRDEIKYGTGTAPLSAFAAGAARGVTFGLSDQTLVSLDLVNQDTLRKLKEVNPATSIGGEAAGILGSLLVAPEVSLAGKAAQVGERVAVESLPIAAKIASRLAKPGSMAAKVLTRAPSYAAGSAVEGALYGLGTSISENALGEADLVSQRTAANIGFGALIGGALGGAMGTIFKSEITPAMRAAAAQDEIAAQAMRSSTKGMPLDLESGQIPGFKSLAEMSAEKTNILPPESLQALRQQVKEAAYQGIQEGLPAKEALMKTLPHLEDLQYKPHAAQLESLTDQGTRDFYKTLLESQTDVGRDLRAYEAIQKQEALAHLKADVQKLSPIKVTDDVMKGGSKLVDDITAQYTAEKKLLEPFFKSFDEAGKGIAQPLELIGALDRAIPGAEKLTYLEGSVLKLKPYEETMSVTEDAYNAIKGVVKAVNKESVTVSEIRNLRKNIGNKINWASGKESNKELSAIKRELMDFMQAEVEKSHPDMNVREGFKRYAINEQHRETLEKIMGGSISDKASFAKEIKKEDVLDKIFASSVSVNATKEILGPKKFGRVLGDYLSKEMKKITDEAGKGFSSQKFHTFLMKKGPELSQALKENPKVLERLNALADYMRILPDAPSVNPSGTAKTLGILERIRSLSDSMTPSGIAKGILKKVGETAENRRSEEIMNQILSGKSMAEATKRSEERLAHYSVLRKIEETAQKTTKAITKSAKGIFDFAGKMTIPGSGYVGEKIGEKINTYEKTKKNIEKLAKISDPDTLMAFVEANTLPISGAAPNISQEMSVHLARAASFLVSKIPQEGQGRPLTGQLPVSSVQLGKFERYYSTVDNPLSVMDMISSGFLMTEHLETLANVYPGLYNEMKSTVMDTMTEYVAKRGTDSIPLKTRIGLSLFLGQNLDNCLEPKSIIANQSGFSANTTPLQPKPMKLNIANESMTAMQSAANRT